jgi:hypothetical protein
LKAANPEIQEASYSDDAHVIKLFNETLLNELTYGTCFSCGEMVLQRERTIRPTETQHSWGKARLLLDSHRIPWCTSTSTNCRSFRAQNTVNTNSTNS